MVSTLDYLAGCKFGPYTGSNRARAACMWRCAQLVSGRAMGCVAESYHCATVGIRYSNTWLANSKPSNLINNEAPRR